jgi:hypothetical protein
VSLWTETACRFRPKSPAGFRRNRLPKTPKFADGGTQDNNGRHGQSAEQEAAVIEARRKHPDAPQIEITQQA